METTKEKRRLIIQAGRKAVDELIKVAEEKIVTGGEDDVSVDRLKNAAATKKLAIFDAFEILTRIDAEENMLNDVVVESNKTESFKGFAEKRKRN